MTQINTWAFQIQYRSKKEKCLMIFFSKYTLLRLVILLSKHHNNCMSLASSLKKIDESPGI